MKRLLATIILLAIIAAPVFAQWSDDPMVNTTVNDQTGEQTQPKVGSLSDDGFYVGFYNHSSGNYDIYLQRYDVDGNALWADGGIAISTNPALSWITDWTMFVDSNDNAILTFNDGRDGGDFDAFAYKISPTGEFLWGANGVQLSANDVGDMFPTVTELTDGSFIFAWNSENDNGQVIMLHHLGADGAYLWTNPAELSNTTGFTNGPGLVPTSDGNFILTFSDNTGVPWAPTRMLYARKYNTDLSPQWLSDATISDAGGISAWSNPVVISDENDGLIYAWYDDQNMSNRYTARVQRVNSTGTILFGEDGLELSPLPSEQNFEPYPVYLPNTDEVMVFWGTTNLNQSSWGIRAQLVNNAGEIQWTSNGEIIVDLNSDRPKSFLDAQYCQGDGVVTWIETQGAAAQIDHVYSIRYSASLNQEVWASTAIVSNSNNDKLKKKGAANSLGMMCYAWVGNDNIYAQNVNSDGTLGAVVEPMPGLEITSPEDGSSFVQLPLNIEFDLENFEMDNATPENGDGVILVELDDEFLAEYAGTSPFVIGDLIEGEHTISMTLIDGPGGNPLDPNVTDEITVTYNIPTITITSPEEGEEITGSVFNLAFELTHFEMDNENPSEGDGVIQIILDGMDLEQYAGPSPLMMTLVEGGEHTITLVLYDDLQGSPLVPEVSDSVTFTINTNSVEDIFGSIPADFTLRGNYPNPFNAQTSIKFGLPSTADVNLEIYSITGQKVMTYDRQSMSAGWHTVTWDASDVSSGVYFVQMKSGSTLLTHKMMLIK